MPQAITVYNGLAYPDSNVDKTTMRLAIKVGKIQVDFLYEEEYPPFLLASLLENAAMALLTRLKKPLPQPAQQPGEQHGR